MRIKAIVSYDGYAYFGFQRQPRKEQPTIQHEIERVLSRILSFPTTIAASGRTDRGVHALAQVFHFDSKEKLCLKHIRYAMNRLLPDDIEILSLEEVNEDFHARFSVVSKEYRYFVYTGDKNPFYTRYRHRVPLRLKIDLMQQAAQCFIGTHNFQNFCTNKEEDSYWETIEECSLLQEEENIIFVLRGSGFKRYMVRMIVGTLIAVGQQRIDIERVRALIDQTERNVVSFKVPSCGLYLWEVEYQRKEHSDDSK